MKHPRGQEPFVSGLIIATLALLADLIVPSRGGG
jgi:hypothetical protein